MKKLSLFFVILFLLTMLVPIVARAAESESIAVEYGNEWVYDEAQVVSDKTEAYIKHLNETVFANYKNKPQLAIMVINDLPYNMDQYKLDTFNDYGVGTAEENCGMLFVFAINDREYGLEIGDGFAPGSFLRADLETDFVTAEMKSYLKAEDYDTAIMMIVQHLAELMTDQENGVYAQKEAEKATADKAAADAVIEKINQIGTVEYTNKGIEAVNNARNAYNKLTPEQKKLVSNHDVLVAASDALDALQRENNMKILKSIGLGFCILCPIAGLIALCIILIKKKLRKDKIDELCNQYCTYVRMAALTEDAVKKQIDEKYGEYSAKDLETEFMNILYQMYIDQQVVFLKNTSSNLAYRVDVYISELHRVNDRPAFERCRLNNLTMIINYVDKRERKKEELRAANKQKVSDFLSANRRRVSDSEIWVKLSRDMHDNFDNFATEITDAQMEKHFSEKLDSMGFKKEFDMFLNANQDKIGRDFSKGTFYMEMCSTDNYRNYHYGHRMDRVWMMHMLMSHMNRQKQNRLEQEKRDREAAERRRREAQRRAQQSSISSRNSSFGSSFGGGRSSGGGFKGGW